MDSGTEWVVDNDRDGYYDYWAYDNDNDNDYDEILAMSGSVVSFWRDTNNDGLADVNESLTRDQALTRYPYAMDLLINGPV